MTHPLTDEMIEEIWEKTGPCDPAYFGERHPSPEEMRNAADWQLEQVIEWLKDELDYDPNLLLDLKEAMRPQQQEDK
jgi:hypothetical protein